MAKVLALEILNIGLVVVILKPLVGPKIVKINANLVAELIPVHIQRLLVPCSMMVFLSMGCGYKE